METGMTTNDSLGNGRACGQSAAPCYVSGDLWLILIGIALIYVGLWTFFYNFKLFPTPPGTLYWWTVPNAITVFSICGTIIACGVYCINKVFVTHEHKKTIHKED